ncbi:MAG: pyridoxamine 5'-phosphate oxidase family protein [Allopontixanthobacter sediminis]
MPDQLEPILKEIRDHLHDGAVNRRSPMHTPAVGTSDGDLRVMVLRGFNRDAMSMRFHTDARSAKVSAIREGPAISVLFYDPEAKVQIRTRGIAVVDQDGTEADAAWTDSTPFARRCYLSELPPGASTDEARSGLPDWVEGIVPTEAQLAPARKNFAVFTVRIHAIDWLYLANAGHRRARFEFSDGNVESRWLVP